MARHIAHRQIEFVPCFDKQPWKRNMVNWHPVSKVTAAHFCIAVHCKSEKESWAGTSLGKA